MESKNLEALLITTQTELQQLKATLNPCIVFINEIMEVRKKRNLTENASHSLLSILNLEIKADILKEIRSAYATQDQVDLLRDVIEDNTRETIMAKDLVFKLEEDVRGHKASINQLDYSAKDHKDKIEDMKYQLDGKSSTSSVQELRHLVKNCATLSALELVKNRISECAGKYQLEDMQRSIMKLEKKLKKYPKVTQLKDSLDVLKDDIRYLLEKDFVAREMFSKEKEGILRKIKFEEERLTELSSKVERNESMFMKKLGALKKNLESCPWNSSIMEIHNILLDKTSYDDLTKLHNEIKKSLDASSCTLSNFHKSILSFEVVLARFDEILLIKAEKDDIRRIDQKVEILLEKKVFDEFSSSTHTSIEKIHDAIKILIKSADITDKHIESISAKCNTLVKENIDVSVIARSIQELREVVDRKANKEDIYEIYDTMGRKNDLAIISDSIGVMRKQLELSAVLFLSLSRTLLKNGENPFVVQKKREELLSSLNSLVNWISGESTGPGPGQKPLLSAYPPDMFHKECNSSLDDRNCRTATSKPMFRRNSQPTKPDQKITVDFPKIKMI